MGLSKGKRTTRRSSRQICRSWAGWSLARRHAHANAGPGRVRVVETRITNRVFVARTVELGVKTHTGYGARMTLRTSRSNSGCAFRWGNLTAVAEAP